jgi:hypothetical protein
LRLTYHPMADRVIGWHPDGKRVLFASSRESGTQRFSQFYPGRPRRRCAREAARPLRRIRRHCPGTARTSSTCPCPWTFAPGNAIGGLDTGPLAVQSQDLHVAQPDERSGQRRPADVARQHDLLRLGSRPHASATTSGRSMSPPARPGRSHSSTTSI